MMDIVERLRFDAARCEATFSKGVATNIEEAAAKIERLEFDLAMHVRADCSNQERIAAQDSEIETLKHGCDASQAENERLRAALESLTKDPPSTLPREPDTDAEVIIKMRSIARAALGHQQRSDTAPESK